VQVAELRTAPPEFQLEDQLEDELFAEGGRDVMTGQGYKRRRKERG